jgi:hypothetical protein
MADTIIPWPSVRCFMLVLSHLLQASPAQVRACGWLDGRD